MDREVIGQKLESLRRCLKRVADKCPLNAETLGKEPDLQDIVTLNLTRAVQLCVDLGSHILSSLEIAPPDTMGAIFDALAGINLIEKTLAVRLKKAVGFRNVVVHEYESIDWNIVYAIAQHHLHDFSEFAEAIVSYLENTSST